MWSDSGVASSDFIFPCRYRTDQEIQTYTIAVINALFLKAPDERRQVSSISLVLKLFPGLAMFGAEGALSCPSWGPLGLPAALWLGWSA